MKLEKNKTSSNRYFEIPVYSYLTLGENGQKHILTSEEIIKTKRGRGKPKKIEIEFVIKSGGNKEAFDWEKIEKSVILAGRDTNEYTRSDAKRILQRVHAVLALVRKNTISTMDIRTVVEPIMADEGYFKTARYYILIKERKDLKKKKKFVITEPVISEVGAEIAKKRYLRTDDSGKTIETIGQMFWRVANHLAKAEVIWGTNDEVETVARDFFERMINWKFVCSGKAMFEAGNPGGTGQLSACFVLPIEDSIGSIFRTLGDAAVVHKNNGGTGFNFSSIRPHGDKVKNVPGAASGPVDFIKAFSAALSQILQGAKRQGANIAILNANHPDIIDFVNLKDVDGTIKNFNISVGVTNEFMDAVEKNRDWKLINPRNREVVRVIKARELFDMITKHAWISGDPGLAFLDRMEEDNPTPSLGKIDATNPCGEIPLLPYESCNLASISLVHHIIKDQAGDYQIDWDDLEKSVRLATRFLDNMIEVNAYPLKEIEEMVKYGNRRIGLGVMGFGHLLYKLKIPYRSKEAVGIAGRLAKFIHKTAESESIQLAKVRGVFPNFDISIYTQTAERYRNCALTMVAPTGTISLLANTSSGIEPVFSLVALRRAFNEDDNANRPTREFMIVDPIFEEALLNLKAITLKSKSTGKSLSNKDDILSSVAEHGLGDIVGLPKWFYRVFVTTHDIEPEWHVKIQAEWQKWFDNSISKTINFSHNATVEDVKKAYILAWKLGCKGITIYRDQSKQDQVINLVGSKSDTPHSSKADDKKVVQLSLAGKLSKNKLSHDMKVDMAKGIADSVVCAECGGVASFLDGCITCRDCGWSKCVV
ncbi:adenosylcobalamin-dependent ribonucleoside-diphosphate reductase [Candidatus Woesebacteria bacterium]|nr:MAG: adenosylcobalamin-dependent ribonucleoside-diphosphate reductase [Candidatus Woesebacteria bacterium]